MMEVENSTFVVTFDGSALRALVSQTDSVINAMRGKTDDKKRWNLAMIEDEIPEAKRSKLKPGAAITLTGLGAYAGKIEETDFTKDAGVTTFFVS